MPKHERRGKLGRLAIILLIAAIAAGWWNRGAGDTSEWLACDRFDFPCTWSEVDPDVFVRSLALGEEAAERLEAASTESVASWLRTQPHVAEVLQSDEMVVFRLEGARRIWLRPDLLSREAIAARVPNAGVASANAVPRPSALAASLGAAEPWSLTPRPLHAQEAAGSGRQGGVVGRDYDGDGKITQRDPREAVILVPDPHLYLSEASEIQDLLLSAPGYDFEGSVRLLQGPEAGVDAFRTWNDYDLVHVATRSATVCKGDDGWIGPRTSEAVGDENCLLMLATGTVVDPSEVDDRTPRGPSDRPNYDDHADRPEYQAWVNSHGLEIFGVLNEQGDLEWRLFAAQRYFRDTYPPGVRRAFVFLNASNEWSLTSIGDVLAGSPAQSTVLMWRSARTVDEGHDLAVSFYERAVEGWAPYDVVEEFLSDVECAGPTAPLCRASVKADVDLRIREVVSIRTRADSDPNPPRVEDGQTLESLMDDPLAGEPTIDFSVDVHGIMPADEGIPVRLELDGEQIAERQVAEADEDIDGHTLRLYFEDVPIDPDVQDGEEHELEAILSLPRGGESRYAARLTTIDRKCYWEVDASGPISGRFHGAGVRLMLGEEFSVLQLDSGVNPERGPDRGPLTALSLFIQARPTLGEVIADEGIAVYADNGIPVSISPRGSVDLTTLTEDSTGRTNEVAGTFEVEFTGSFINKRVVRELMTVRGQFRGHMIPGSGNAKASTASNGCGSESFRWFGAPARAAQGS